VSIKPQSKESIRTINEECLKWLTYQSKLRKEPIYSDAWFVYKRERDVIWALIKNMTGLNARQVDDLIYNKSNTMTYWEPNGQIKRVII
jgi:hypothetical protein